MNEIDIQKLIKYIMEDMDDLAEEAEKLDIFEDKKDRI